MRGQQSLKRTHQKLGLQGQMNTWGENDVGESEVEWRERGEKDTGLWGNGGKYKYVFISVAQ
jgi:hypothetical protein